MLLIFTPRCGRKRLAGPKPEIGAGRRPFEAPGPRGLQAVGCQPSTGYEELATRLEASLRPSAYFGVDDQAIRQLAFSPG